ncbi:hypothetical protein Dsin_004026 [Dipteronia sinensis]|uniref:Uncharacterized protein n=1 Tax=Dipteronia sinensis TaxID=43782 RepID=A0AAE0BA84_9ROSI|nr:hypothetical protein Dsin_004026 [Dipteronia sinensis]
MVHSNKTLVVTTTTIDFTKIQNPKSKNISIKITSISSPNKIGSIHKLGAPILQFSALEIKKIQLSARDHFQKISNDHEKLKLQLESQKTELELRGVDLEKREARNENDRKTLAEEIEQIAVRNSSLQLASAEQQKADEDVMNLAEDHKREKEKLHDKILQLERQLDAKHNLELEIQTLKGTFNVMKHMGDGDDGDAEVLEKMDTILKDLREKEGELEDLDALNQTLVVKERKSNDELQEARKELVNVSTFEFHNLKCLLPITNLLVANKRKISIEMVLLDLGTRVSRIYNFGMAYLPFY